MLDSSKLPHSLWLFFLAVTGVCMTNIQVISCSTYDLTATDLYYRYIWALN